MTEVIQIVGAEVEWGGYHGRQVNVYSIFKKVCALPEPCSGPADHSPQGHSKNRKHRRSRIKEDLARYTPHSVCAST